MITQEQATSCVYCSQETCYVYAFLPNSTLGVLKVCFQRYDELYAPVSGPANPFKTQQQAAHKNTLAGLVEDAHVNEFQFETQRRTFHR